MEELCKKLIKTYNTNILDKQDKITQSAFYSISKNNNTVLSKLIQNHYKRNKPIIQYIGGPFILKHLKRNDINIYLFGEKHSVNIDCKVNFDTIENYFENLLKYTDVFLDIYFEFPAFFGLSYTSFRYKENSRLQALFSKFKDCVQTVFRSDTDMCKLARVHYVDIRRIDSDNFNNLNHISWLTNNINNIIYNIAPNVLSISIQNKELLKLIANNQYRINYILNSLGSENEKDYIDFFISLFRDNYFLRKELDKSYKKEEIINYMQEQIIEIALQKKKPIQMIVKQIRNTRNDNYIFNYTDLINLLSEVNAKLLDIYTISRMFRKFNIENKFNEPEIPHNIIFYGGADHSRSIYEFLIYTGFTEVESSGDFTYNPIPENCLDMSKIKQPLF